MNFNKVILAGNLTRDPELRYLPNGKGVASFGLAINRKWKSDQGEAKQEATFVDCTCFGTSAENITKFCKKGSPLLVEGRLKTDSWEDKTTKQSRTKLVVIVDNLQLMGEKPEQDSSPRRESRPPYPTPLERTENDDCPF